MVHRVAISAVACEQSALRIGRKVRHVGIDQQFECGALFGDLVDHREHAWQRCMLRIRATAQQRAHCCVGTAEAGQVVLTERTHLAEFERAGERTACVGCEVRIGAALGGVQQHGGDVRIAQPLDHRARRRRAGVRQQRELLEHRRANRRMHVDVPACIGLLRRGREESLRGGFKGGGARCFVTVLRGRGVTAAEQAVQIVVEVAARRAHRVEIAEHDQQTACERYVAGADSVYELRQQFDRGGFVAVDAGGCEHAAQRSGGRFVAR